MLYIIVFIPWSDAEFKLTIESSIKISMLLVLQNNPKIKALELNRLDVITDSDREEGKDYISLMNENLDLLKQELYQ